MRSWSFVVSSVVVCASMVTASPAPAQQSVFEGDITVVATGSEEGVEDVPVPVTVVDRQEIEDSQEGSVAELLRRVPGVTVARSGGEGSATSLFTRGTESDHTIAMFDGVRLNSPYFAGYDWSLLPTAGLDRIEVARGPFSALWGADAIGGVVNVVPSRVADGLQSTVHAEAGDDGWQRLEAAAGWASDGFDVYASAYDREGHGELDNSGFDSRQVLVDAGWSWSDGSRVAVLTQDLTSDVGIPFTSPAAPSPNRRQRTDQRLVAVPLRIRAADRWDVELVASSVERDFAFRDPDDPFGYTASDTAADTLQARLASHHRVDGHQLSWGAEWREDSVTDASSYGTNLDDASSSVSSLFVQDVWQESDATRVIAGVRWDDADEWGSEVSPRVSVGWRVNGDVELRAGYGRAFRQPSVGELYYPFSGNPGLEPERSESFEAGATIAVGGSRIQASLFETRIDQLVIYDNAAFVFANVADAEITGAEAGWDVPLTGRLVSTLQATWLDTSDGDGLELLRRPKWSAAWTVHGGLTGRLRGSIGVVWVGSRPDLDPISFERIELPSHLTGDVSLSYEVTDGLEVLARVRNLGDERYEEIAGYPAPGRRFTGGLRWRP